MSSSPSPAEIIPAATLVIFRRNPRGGAAQVLMVERSRALVFAGGAAVFPGGRVDPADHALAARSGGKDLDDTAARIAAIRETLEETGLALGLTGPIDADSAAQARAMLLTSGDLAPVLARFDWRLNLAALHLWARWVPPTHPTRIFDTRFYIADLGTGAVDIAVDETENSHLFWTTAAEALALADAGRIKTIYPTRRNLERLAQFETFAGARRHAAQFPPRKIITWTEQRDGRTWLRIPADAGYPVDGEPLDRVERG